MPISVTCECGSHLEIDEKFLGKEIPCPDCQRPLPTKAPPKPPPLDLPDSRRTSGLAVMSLAVGLAGMFTFIGSLAAIALGLFALRAIHRSKKLEGVKLARAGIIVGGAGIVATLVILITPLGLDGIYRELALEFLGRKSYSDRATIESASEDYAIKRPSTGRWATFQPQSHNNSNVPADKLIAVNVSADAYMACQQASFDDVLPDEETIQKKILDRLRNSELVNLVGRLNGRQAPEPTNVVLKKIGDVREITLDMRLGGIERRFLILYKAGKDPLSVKFLVGCARATRFERVEEQFREAFTGFRFPAL
jgi:hypothetical protein